MKSKTFFVLIISLLLTFSANAQKDKSKKFGTVNLKYTVGKRSTAKRMTAATFHVKSTTTSHTMMRFKFKGLVPFVLLFPYYHNLREHVYLDSYDENLKLVGSKKVKGFEVYVLGRFKKRYNYLIDIATIDEKDYAFYYKYNRKLRQVEYYSVPLNLESDGYMESEAKLLSTVKAKNNMFAGYSLQSGFIFSEDKKNFLLYYKQRLKRKERKSLNGRSKYKFVMFDSEMKKQYGVSYTMKAGNQIPTTNFNELNKSGALIRPVVIDNLGSFYFIETQTVKNKKLLKRRMLDIYVTGYNRPNKKMSSEKITSEKKALIDFYLTVDQDNTAITSSLFLKDKGAGIQLSTIDSAGEFNEIANQNFSAEDFKKLLEIKPRDGSRSKRKEAKDDKKEARMAKNIVTSLKIREIIKNSDNSYMIFAEQFFITVTTTTNSNGSTSTHTNYHYCDMFVFKLTEEGEVQNIQRIPKYYVTTDARVNSFVVKRTENDVRILFYDFAKKSKSNVSIAIISNESDKIKISNLSPLSISRSYYINISTTAYLSDNVILGMAQRGKRVWMFKAKIKA